VRLCKSRSSPLPLHISVSLYNNVGGVLHDECFSLLKHILNSNSGDPESIFQRCRSLSWTFVRGVSDVALAARTFISASFPALEYMTIENLIVLDHHPTIGSPRLPRLKGVTLIDHSEVYTPPFFHDDDFANVEKLTYIVTSASKWMYIDVACVGRFRNIRILILKGERVSDDVVERPRDKPVVLSLLETLTLSGNVQRNILDHIRTPGLRRLEIEAEKTTGWHSLSASHLVHFVGSLEHLSVSFGEELHGTSWDEELERVIAEAPLLVSVWVCPWMVQYLMGKEWCAKLRVTDPK